VSKALGRKDLRKILSHRKWFKQKVILLRNWMHKFPLILNTLGSGVFKSTVTEKMSKSGKLLSSDVSFSIHTRLEKLGIDYSVHMELTDIIARDVKEQNSFLIQRHNELSKKGLVNPLVITATSIGVADISLHPALIGLGVPTGVPALIGTVSKYVKETPVFLSIRTYDSNGGLTKSHRTLFETSSDRAKRDADIEAAFRSGSVITKVVWAGHHSVKLSSDYLFGQ
jgi:hypothetical protein